VLLSAARAYASFEWASELQILPVLARTRALLIPLAAAGSAANYIALRRLLAVIMPLLGGE